MKPNTYFLMQRCIEAGTDAGWRRAHKHVDTPDETLIRTEIKRAIENEFCEWFIFDDVGET